jgi:cellulose synthase/poly-beta-1,6-N-acetylglucosamine synthase-like glycosyltransferase
MTLPFWLEGLAWLFLAYFVGLNLVYLMLSLVALHAATRETAVRTLSTLPAYTAGLEPGITICIPAYNEEATIAESVRSMLQVDYPDFEIIVTNDGSKDDTIEVLRREFALQPFQLAYRRTLPVQHIRAFYRSPRHPNLLVIDKDNGGRSDAVNAAVNAARHGLICAVDADSVLERDSLRRVVRPFIEDPLTIASGGTVRISNGCQISRGYMQRVDVAKGWLARIQVLEYLRGFHNGRIGWAPLNALLIISGAFGVFRRTTLVEAGGFSTRTIGEDMEMTMRLHRFHRMAGRAYRIAFVPDAVCWTEAPESLPVLRSQRMRWQRGLMESLWTHRQLFFHPKAGAVGWLACPAMLLIEGLGPVIELCGYVVMALLVLLGLTSWASFGAFLLLAFGTGLMLSASALLLEEVAFRTYPRPRHLAVLLLAMVVENLGYRQLTVWWRTVGVFKWLTGQKQRWGDMQRRGVGGADSPASPGSPGGRP